MLNKDNYVTLRWHNIAMALNYHGECWLGDKAENPQEFIQVATLMLMVPEGKELVYVDKPDHPSAQIVLRRKASFRQSN
jgi:hypothetical protein